MKQRHFKKKARKEIIGVKCSAKGCMRGANSYGGTSREIDVQWCHVHREVLVKGGIVETKNGFFMKKANYGYEPVQVII